MRFTQFFTAVNFIIFIAIASPITAFAQQLSENQAEEFTPHYAFSNYFGSGLYQSTGQDITVFNLPFEYEPEQQGRNRYRIRLPVSIGFYDFELEDIDFGTFTDDSATLTLTLGIEFDHWVNDDLKLVPFIDIGLTENFSNDETAAIYASGLSAYYYFNAFGEDHLWLTRLQRAGFKTLDTGISDGFFSFESGIDIKMPFRFTMQERSYFVSSYLAAYWYSIGLAFDPQNTNAEVETNAQEFGFTLGTETPFDMVFFDLERIGIGYRYSKSGPDIIRLSFNMPLE
jgi:hypothetical protein